MKIARFFSSLLPNFEGSRITADLVAQRRELEDTLIPSLTQLVQVTANRKNGMSRTTAEFDKQFIAMFPEHRRNGSLAGLNQIMQNLQVVVLGLEKLVQGEFGREVAKEAISYRKATILQLIEAIRFTTGYTGLLLQYIIANETATNTGNNSGIHFVPADIKRLKEEQQAYFQTLSVLAKIPATFAKTVEQIPDIRIVPEQEDEVMQTAGSDRVDPFKTRFISANINPIYHIRINIAEWQAARYHASIALKTSLELRLLQLKQSYGETQDPKLAEMIAYNEGRLTKLRLKIQKIEERYA